MKTMYPASTLARTRAGRALGAGPACPGANRSAALVERRRGQEGDRRVRADDHHAGQPEVRATSRAHRHLRPGRHAVGRASDVLAGDVHPRKRAGAGQGEARTRQGRPVLDGAGDPEGRSRGDRQADHARPREAGRGHADRHAGRYLPRRSEEVACRSEGPALEEAVYRTHLPADAGSAEVPARQRLQDLHRHRRRAGLRARVFRKPSTASRPSR